MAGWRRGPLLGRGSSATVSLATVSTSGDLIAVKSADFSKSSLLQNEQSILSTLDCPQIITYLGFEHTHLHYNLFLEYAPGGSLSDHIRNPGGQFDGLTIRSHTHEILTGLSYLHSRGIVHCDIKPQNILIGSDGRAKIADLGCARWLDEASYQLKGTPMYMAPEVARGEEQGPAADVWALGCTVLEMLTGSSPWSESDPISTLHNISFSAAVPEIPSRISDEGHDFLKKCLVRDLKQRWTVDQLLNHPFAKLCSTKYNQDFRWSSITPKSMLDRDLWESFSDKEEEDEEPYVDNRDRIRELEGSCSDAPHWTCDESWITIRSNNEECSMTSMANDEGDKDDYGDDEEEKLDVLPSETTSTISGGTQDVGNLFYERHDYILIDHDCYEISECRNGREMHHPCCCKSDIVWFTYKSNDIRKIYKPTLHSQCLTVASIPNCWSIVTLFRLSSMNHLYEFVTEIDGPSLGFLI